jgi:hypothetical protein
MTELETNLDVAASYPVVAQLVLPVVTASSVAVTATHFIKGRRRDW